MVISRRVLTKIGCVAVAASMVLSVAGCFGGKAKAEVIEAADAFGSAVKKADPAKIIKLTTEEKDSDFALGLETILSDDLYTEDQIAFNNAVEGTIEYTVDEDSVEVDGESAECDIVFTMVDYEKVIEDGEFEDIDGLVAAIEDSEDTIEITYTAEFELDDEEWLVSNADDKDLGKVYDYLSAELPVAAAADISGLLDYTDWFYDDDNGTYAAWNSYIELDLWFTSDIYNVDPEANYITYEVYYNDGLVYTSESVPVGGSSYIELMYGEEQGATMTDAGYMAPGDYEIIVYLPDGTSWVDESCVVLEDEVPTTQATDPTTDPSTSAMFEFQDASFEAKSIDAGWWDYAGTMPEDGVFCSDTETIAFSIQVDPSETEEITYNYYYSEDDDMSDEEMATPAYTATIAPTVYPNTDTYYDIDYTPSEMVPGYYLLVVSDTSEETAYLFAACQVVEATSAEY
ncbi:MAG: hypothetical protein K5745_03240 [Saccharofermentans sp.]|nr:hypothetical protein [Saccharofermentans sp.]